MGEKFFVCGGTGYLGTRVVRKLAAEGNYVKCVKRENSDISGLSGYGIDFCTDSREEVRKAFREDKFGWVLNMSCVYGEGDVLYEDMLEANVVFPLRVLNTAVKCGTGNFLTVGTGLPGDFNMYSFSKKKFGEFGEFYAKTHGINFYCLEPELFYGEGEPKNRFISYCIEKMSGNEPVLLTEGTQRRDIVYIDDVVDAVLHVVHSCRDPGFGVFPVGTGEAPRLREVVEYIHGELGSESELVFGAVPMRKGEPDCVADISELEKSGFRVRYPWREGIRRMLVLEGMCGDKKEHAGLKKRETV